jgi:hypothetical protein
MAPNDSRKRRLEDSNAYNLNEVNLKSKAARFNLYTLKKLQEAVEEDPEIDITSKLPMEYSRRVSEMRNSTKEGLTRESLTLRSDDGDDDIRWSLHPPSLVEVVHPLSEQVEKLLADHTPVEVEKDEFQNPLSKLLWRCEILWKSTFPRNKMVFKCGPDIVVKAIRNADDYTEFTTLQYLEKNKPTVPAPRPLGLLRTNRISLVFMSYIPEMTLGEIWTQLDFTQKISIQNQLNQIILDMRSLTLPEGMPLGGVAGEGCKDVKRHLRRSTIPITNASDFEKFLFPPPKFSGHVFAELVRELIPLRQSSSLVCHIFTHGDLRPDNISVKLGYDGNWQIAGLVDWEYSGFYPDYYESIKSTNCMASNEHDDWYSFLPQCISPQKYKLWWLIDRIWATSLE